MEKFLDPADLTAMYRVIVFLLLISFPMNASASGRAKVLPVVAENGMVASAHPLASEVGVNILKKGGNAVDAAVATAFALGVVEPYASGIGGGGFMVIYLASSNDTFAIDYRETAPLQATRTMYLASGGGVRWDEMKMGHRSAAVPGMVAGLALAVKKFGSMDLRTLIAPSIELAERGYSVNGVLHRMMKTYVTKLVRFREAKRIFLRSGNPFREGDKIYLKDLGASYRLIANEGPEAFYHGRIARVMEEEMKRVNGLITRGDLGVYRAVLREPVKGEYRGHRIFSMAPPSSGGTHLIQLLNILEGFDLAGLGHNSSSSVEIMVEAMKRVFSDRSRFMGDPDFVEIPLETLLSKDYAVKIREKMGIPGRGQISRPDLVQESDQTTHLSVVDQKGNLVALTQTINSFFGSGIVLPGTGILLNNQMNDFDPIPGRPNSVEPQKRPVSSMSPTIVLKSGKPFLSFGMPGARRIISVLPQILINLLDYKMNIQEAINSPRVHYEDGEIWMEPQVPKAVQQKLIRKKYKIALKESFDLWFGGAQAVMIDPQSGKRHGGADPRREGSVMGY